MKRLPKYTPAEVRNDPYGFTYKEMSEVIGENEAKALYEELYKQLPRKKNLSMLVKNICKSSDTEKYVYELKDNKYIETVFIKRACFACACEPSGISPVSGTTGITPEVYTIPFTSIACEYGPIAAGALSVLITFFILLPFFPVKIY